MRLLLDRVQVEPVVVVPPGVPQRRSGLEHQRIDVSLLETGRRGQTGRTGAHNHHGKRPVQILRWSAGGRHRGYHSREATSCLMTPSLAAFTPVKKLPEPL